VRLIASVSAVLAVLAAIATAAAVGLAMFPDASGGWVWVLAFGAAAVAFGAVAITLWRRLE
jgi:hypothetical protein